MMSVVPEYANMVHSHHHDFVRAAVTQGAEQVRKTARQLVGPQVLMGHLQRLLTSNRLRTYTGSHDAYRITQSSSKVRRFAAHSRTL